MCRLCHYDIMQWKSWTPPSWIEQCVKARTSGITSVSDNLLSTSLDPLSPSSLTSLSSHLPLRFTDILRNSRLQTWTLALDLCLINYTPFLNFHIQELKNGMDNDGVSLFLDWLEVLVVASRGLNHHVLYALWQLPHHHPWENQAGLK